MQSASRHPGDLPPAVSMAPSSPCFLITLPKAEADRQASVPPAEFDAIAIQITVSLDCPDLLGNYFINISAVSVVIFLPRLLAVIVGRNALKHSLIRTNQHASQTQPLACRVWEDQKVKLKNVAGSGRRNIHLTSALASVSPSVLHLWIHHVTIQVDVSSHMHPR